jgi:hypothetical protein
MQFKKKEPDEREIINRAVDTCDQIIERHLKRQKESQAGRDLPVETLRMMLQARHTNRFDAALLILEEEAKNGVS